MSAPVRPAAPAPPERQAAVLRTAARHARARRRQAALFVCAGLALAGLAGRLAYWQVALHGPLAARADAEHLATLSIPAGRGAILDANGRILALSVTRYAVDLDPGQIRRLGLADATARRLARLLGLPEDLVRRQLDTPGDYARLRDARGATVLLGPEQTGAVEDTVAAGDLPGVQADPVVLRQYPDGALASQVLGFVRTSDGTGQYGVEAREDAALAGQPGRLVTAVDASGDPLVTGPRRWTPAVPGAGVTLTIDANVQAMAERGLADAVARTGADGGTVIVLDPRSGAILAMASLPAFDPNDYAAAPLSAFTDPAVSAVYDPGSVMKAMTMAAGIQAGAITPDTSFYDPGYMVVDGVTIHNAGGVAWGQETMTQVLQHSANVGAAWVARRVGSARFGAFQAAFGFGAPTGVDLPDEASGSVPRPARDADLTLAEQAFGESMAVTPLQVAAAYGALANGGVLMRPYVVGCVTQDGGLGARTCAAPRVAGRVVSAATAATVTRMLAQSDLQSDAQMDRIVGGYSVAAKTGTSTPDPAHPAVTYASVVGYAPASDPRFVLLVKLDHPRAPIYGGAAAGPLWRSLAQQLFVYERIPPDEPAGGA